MKLEIMGPNSWCCRVPTQYVQSMPGGYVTRNCTSCNKPSKIGFSEFESLALEAWCARCESPMTAEYVWVNYGFSCPDCRIARPLGDMLHHWSEIESARTTPKR